MICIPRYIDFIDHPLPLHSDHRFSFGSTFYVVLVLPVLPVLPVPSVLPLVPIVSAIATESVIEQSQNCIFVMMHELDSERFMKKIRHVIDIVSISL
jgi:hypothetical protein